MRLPLILARQGDVLRASPSFRLLFGSTLISGLGTWIAVIALVVDVKDRTGSAVWVSALLIADFLPGVAIGLLFGPLVDRLSRKRILIGADLTRCAVFVLLALAVSSGQIVALALVAGIASGFARPAAYAGLPNLVSEELLPRANSLLRAADQLTIMAGTVLGGILVAVSGPDLAYWLNAASFAISAVLVVRISASLLQEGKVQSEGHWHDVAEGFSAILRSRPLMAVLVSWSIATVTIGVANVAEVFLATVSFDAGSFGYGLMWTASGLGAVVGALFASSWLERRRMTVVYASAIALMGIGDIAAGCSPNVWVAIWFVLLGGAGNASAIVCNSLLVQRGSARPPARPRLHGADRRDLGSARDRDGADRPARGRRRAPLGLRDRGRRRPRRRGGRIRHAAAGAGSCPRAGNFVSSRRDWTRETLLEGIRAGDRRALARAITLVESSDPLAYDLVRELYPQTGRAYVLGLTGPPGVGKSSLIGALLTHVRGLGQTAGVVSVDPSSPFSRGALLGDRIRLSDHFLDPGVFIRSMGTRGHVGGLSEATLQAALLLDAAGKDLVFVETVGTGQSEIEVIGVADTVLLVLMPGSGDSIQALKAGIMEIPDVIAINKMDHPAARTMLNEVRSVLALDRERAWKVPIVLTEAQRGENVAELWAKIGEHRAYLERDGLLEERRRRNLAGEVFAVASARAKAHLQHAVAEDPELRRLLDEVADRELDPLSAVREIVEKVFRIDGESRPG